MPSSSMQGSVMQQYNESFVNNIFTSVKKEVGKYNPIGKVLDSNRVTRGAVNVMHKADKVQDAVDRKMS